MQQYPTSTAQYTNGQHCKRRIQISRVFSVQRKHNEALSRVPLHTREIARHMYKRRLQHLSKLSTSQPPCEHAGGRTLDLGQMYLHKRIGYLHYQLQLTPCGKKKQSTLLFRMFWTRILSSTSTFMVAPAVNSMPLRGALLPALPSAGNYEHPTSTTPGQQADA